MRETEIIKKYFLPLCNNFRDALNLEDDAAVLKKFKNGNYVISVDSFIQGVHCPNNLNSRLIILRAILSATSDLAAMGAIPYCIFLSLSLPKNKGSIYFENISKGIKEALNLVNVKIAGGDLTSYDGPLIASVTAVGKNSNYKNLLRRRGGKVNDLLAVTGNIGESFIGLNCIEKKIKIDNKIQKKKAIDSFLYPPRLYNFAYALTKYAKSCIDLSDGLIEDAGKLGIISNCGVSLFRNSIPLSNLGKLLTKKKIFTLSDLLLAGDDYQLAFSFDKKYFKKILNMEKKFKIKISIIGKIIKEKGVYLDGKKVSGGFSHF